MTDELSGAEGGCPEGVVVLLALLDTGELKRVDGVMLWLSQYVVPLMTE